MDSSFVSIGDTITVKEAVIKSLTYLLDANQQLFEIDSDTKPRLIHLRVSRNNGKAPWTCSLENSELSVIAKIFTYGQLGYNPPRIVDTDTGVVVGPRKDTEIMARPPYPGLGKIIIRGGANPWDVEPRPPFAFINQMYDWTVNETPYQLRINYLMMKGQQRYRTNNLSEIGTYIIPICYHRTTDKGFESIQVLRSDASFWPMPIHQVWSMQDNWQHMWRSNFSDSPFSPSLDVSAGYENEMTPSILEPPKGNP